MVRRSAFTTLALLIPLCFAPACSSTKGPGPQAPALLIPDQIADLDDYSAARNAYALMDVRDPERLALRDRLRDFLIGYIDRALERDQIGSSVDALEQLAGLWTPVELRAPGLEPELADVALRVYAKVARSGNERPALLALGLAQAFGDSQAKTQAEASFAEVREWIERTAEFSDDPRFADALDRLLEDATSILPSPFLVEQLARVYLEHYRAAQQKGPISESRDPRVEFTPYLLARLYLRADDLQTAIAAIDRLESNGPTVALRQLIAAAAEIGEARSPADMDQLIGEFIPSHDSRLPPEIIRQSWAIVDNLARRSLQRFPDHPPAHLARGRALRSQYLVEAAIIHYERAFSGKVRSTTHDDLFLAWSELAGLYQSALQVRAETDLPEALRMLERIEGFHARAAELWQHRAIQPSLTDAWMTVAAAEFDAGHVASAEALLERTVAIEPHPAALSLLGLIAMRRGELERARERLRGIEGLAFADQIDRYEWQIDSRIRLGEVELLAGDAAASVNYLREALRQLNTLLSYPGLGEALRAEFMLRRAQVLFFLGDIDQAMLDYRGAQAIAPSRGSVYATPLLFTVVHGHFDQATEIFSASLGADAELRLYFAMWVVDLAARSGRPAPADALEFLRSYAGKKSSDPWLRRLARFSLGELGEGDLESAAGTPRQRSEAFFYEGLRRWRAGNKADGLERMAKVLEQQMLGDFEYEMAQNYLRFKDLPQTARAALTESKR